MNVNVEKPTLKNMTNYSLQEYFFKLKIIGVYQIIGGFIGLGLTIWVITMLLPMPLTIVCIVVIAIGLFLFSIVSGIGLYFKKKAAINSAIVVQVFQIASFSLYGYSLKFVSGLGILINFDFTNILRIQMKLSEPLFKFTYLDDPTLKILSINLVPILMSLFLHVLKRKIGSSYEEQILNNKKAS